MKPSNSPFANDDDVTKMDFASILSAIMVTVPVPEDQPRSQTSSSSARSQQEPILCVRG